MRIVLWPFGAYFASIKLTLTEIPGLEVVTVDDAESFIEALAGAEVAMYPASRHSRALCEAVIAAPRLRWVQWLAVGVDALEADPIPARIMISTLGDSMAVAMAEHAMGLLLALTRNFPVALAQQKQTRWDRSYSRRIIGLDGKTLVIVGYGATGREIAKRAKAFGMHTIGVRRQVSEDAYADEVVTTSALNAVLARADVIAIAASLTRESRRMFDTQRFSHCRPGALLINVSRGALVDTAALLRALACGQIGGAGLDVVDPEPLPPDHPLWRMPNTVLTPHLAVAGSDLRIARMVAANVRRFLDGQALLSQYQPLASPSGPSPDMHL